MYRPCVVESLIQGPNNQLMVGALKPRCASRKNTLCLLWLVRMASARGFPQLLA